MPSSLSFVFFFFSSQGESLSPSSILPLLFVQHLVLCVCIVISYFFLSQCFDFCCFAWLWTVTLHALLVISCTNIGNVIRNLPAYESHEIRKYLTKTLTLCFTELFQLDMQLGVMTHIEEKTTSILRKRGTISSSFISIL